MIDIPAQKSNDELRVLIIDGQSLVHDLIRSALLDANINQVQSAHNSFTALQFCQECQYDLILVAFDVQSDKDGFNLLEEMKFKGHITNTTCVIFLSADTSTGLVNCVVEMEPTDFWVKPLDRAKVSKRILQIRLIEQKLYALRYCFDQAEYATAIYYAQRQLQDLSVAHYHPHINRLIGRALFNLKQYQEAEKLFLGLAQKYEYSWVQVGLVASLLKQNKIESAMLLTDKLLKREDTKFATYDLLAEYYTQNEEYERGYEIIQEATKLAPRSLERNQKSWNLARLNHDRLGQYIATRNMAKYAKNSIHDSPLLTLNVIRAAIDLAITLPTVDTNKLIVIAKKNIEELCCDKQVMKVLDEQLSVIQARILNLQNKKPEAEKIMRDRVKVEAKLEFEDNLDKVKAFHEAGMWEQSIQLLDQIKGMITQSTFTGKVLTEYLEQESKERQNIRYSPKELAEMASAHYKNKRYKPAYDLLCQASQLSPKNANITISLLKVLAIIAEEAGLEPQENESVEQSVSALNKIILSENQQNKFDEYQQRINHTRSNVT